ncbi:nicotinamide-nucleotide amidohydrolase family protein [Hanamia caeni]|jgi:PncC family amidohydrolase|uniref:Nicotinamide-nucleotide amidohydrolase family protein n=1 Tax=Hanamia caeni TaxID=2294116 RepID=A0A3M9N9S5_9BACT|nr:nicotinamide-nucleotide amidohydrolase family protein [Hanamia caeni]RNI34496.1 nicotinamide-nucleotide amidohydrolase family protein [Hanamia caeni]
MEQKDYLKLIDKAGGLLQKKKATIAVAESVTSGNLQAAFSLAMNATTFFQGGITAYNIGQKCRHLLVEPIHALAVNCVSEKVSIEMAKEVCNLFKSDYGIGITGYASPVPEKNIKQLFAHVAIVKGNTLIQSKKIISSHQKPPDTQMDFTQKVLQILIEALQSPINKS